jgi:L-ascorbate metabolism protein UlaG (beta-lactamase superfamily)
MYVVDADMLMLPIGGPGQNTRTTDVDEALEAVKWISLKRVIPYHCSVAPLFKRRLAVTDDQRFKRKAERLCVQSTILSTAKRRPYEHLSRFCPGEDRRSQAVSRIRIPLTARASTRSPTSFL